MAEVNLPSKKKMKKTKDRISDLPDIVLDCILSFLTIKEAVRTSVLCKRWKRVNPCFTLFCLRFTGGFFHTRDVLGNLNSNFRRKNKRALKVVDKILLRERQERDPILQQLYLMIPPNNRHYYLDKAYRKAPDAMRPCPLQHKLDRWMNRVAKLGLTVLDLDIEFRRDEYYNFPLAILASAGSLKVLSLSGFQLMPLSSHEVDLQFSSLLTLCLKRTVLDNFVLQKLLKGSSLIENLQLKRCVGLTILNLKGLICLKVLEIVLPKLNIEKIQIGAPNLTALKVHASPLVLSMADSPRYLHELDFQFFQEHEMAFELQGRQLSTINWFHRLLTMCPLLEHLTISPCKNLDKIGSSTTLNSLKTLNLWPKGNKVKYEIIAPKLEKLYIDATPEFPIVKDLNASKNFEVKVKFLRPRAAYLLPPRIAQGDLDHDQVARFLGSFSRSKPIKFSFEDSSGFFTIPKEKRNKIASPLSGTRNLEFITSTICRKRRNFVAEYVDYMLWLSPRATKLSIRDYSGFQVVLECKHKNIKANVGVASCPSCNLLPVRCWRHSLSEVHIQDFLGDKVEKENLKSFLRREVKSMTFRETCYDPETIEGGLYCFYDELFK